GGAYDCTLNFCMVSNNATSGLIGGVDSGLGGGVYYDSGQTNDLGQGNIVVGNVAAATNDWEPRGGIGGGVFILLISASLNGWTFISNSAPYDGGGLYLTTPRTILNNCIFLGNSSGGNGGGVCSSWPFTAVASNCTFIWNMAAGNGGGACYAALTNCSVIGNKATNGGGVYGIANNCVLSDNVATNDGGGLYYYYGSTPYPAIVGCAFTNNSALNGGGAYTSSSCGFSNCFFCANSAANNGGGIELGAYCLIAHCGIYSNNAGLNGGGVSGSEVSYCIILGNTAGEAGGGTYDCQMANCLLSGNSATYGGGSLDDSFFLIRNCTIANNRATNVGGGFYSTGVWAFGITNCIIYDNSENNPFPWAKDYSNYYPTNFIGMFHCCTVPLPAPSIWGGNNNNITNDPAFVNAAFGDFHLQSNSPCINAGRNPDIARITDLDGNPRIVGGTVDIGAYECQSPALLAYYDWLQSYGLPTDASKVYSDSDGDGMNNYQEWIAGTSPTNALSVLAMLPPAPTNNSAGLVVSWQSVNTRTYYLQRGTNLAAQPAFSTVQSNIVGQTSTTTYTDTNAIGNGPFFYRAGVQ
ncbi:MAG TPA: choice-of-anchor Q domain-containing protein, partial [Verrucomicrobiae bacterium]|nr:choice-of-anchor Q domain-containing protein [Verrucomicrobiae bacterium]